ncbi:MAG: AMP-binding protein, partial [Trebonia sp.]
GARLVVPPVAAGTVPPGASAPGDLTAAIRSAGVSIARMIPIALNALLSRPGIPDLGPALRQVILDGERPWPALLALTDEFLPGVRVTTIGGAAEAAADMLVLSAAAAHDDRPANGGRIRILDTRGELVPIGVPGEVCLDMPSLPRGAGRDPAVTADRLVPDPAVAGGRLYRTGLRARWLADGTLDPLGTADDVAAVSGHRVELSELSACLSSQPDVERGTVLSLPSPDGGEAGLMAYVTLQPDQARAAGDPATWRPMFAERYGGRAAEDDPALNLGGWTSPSTREFLSAGEMREWSEATFHRVMELPHQDVLEIGCRTGSLLFQLASARGQGSAKRRVWVVGANEARRLLSYLPVSDVSLAGINETIQA